MTPIQNISVPAKWLNERAGTVKYMSDNYNADFEIENHIIKTTLYLVNYTRGRSAVNFIMEDNLGNRYSMFLKDFTDMAKRFDYKQGFTGDWAWVKRGSNYGLMLL